MAIMKVVPKEDWQVLQKYLSEQGSVLIPQHTYDELSELHKELIQAGGLERYDFGGDPDVRIDFILNKDSYAMGCLSEEHGYDFSEEGDEA